MMSAPGESGGRKRLSVERIYQKKTQLEHILLRPDTYIGSVQPTTEPMWVYSEGSGMVLKEITFVPGFYKIFDEILVNAADNKQRDPGMDVIKIEINPEKNQISIMNNGRGIPVEMHKEQKMYVPSMIFGHLLTSSNFSDEEAKTTGGRNGFGAKLCNVFSTQFTVETADKEVKKHFKQTWNENMSKAGDPIVKDYGKGEEFTKITFKPDLDKFNMTSLDEDTVSLLNRRAFDVAACCRGVKVFLNGQRLPVKNFKDYVDQYIKGKEDDSGNQIKCVYEQCGPRWEVAVCVSDKGFQQMSFVNSIATTKGGRHVDHVADLVTKSIIDLIKKKNKTGMTIKPFQVKNHLWLFVNCLIVNPTFDSQTKETMTLVAKDFGSKCSFSETFQKGVVKAGIIESVLLWSKFKADAALKNKQSGKKTNKLRGIPKLEDANEAGTKNSSGCTLILTEGDSAKTLAVAGLGVVGRDYYGVYPLKGKLLNVREASQKQIMENKEITDLVKIIGLSYKKKYHSMDDVASLRYGKVMIMTDQDQDGSHIKGLVINFIHHNWPSLMKLPFLEEFITPIVKVTKGNQQQCFYSLPEFQEWKEATDNWHTWKIKYYKGLGTSTSKEAKEYFSDMVRHKIKFKYDGSGDDDSILLAFSKKAVDQRKEWLTNWMEEGKRRKELGLPEVYLYEKDTRAVNYQDFVNKELVLFSNMDNERSIPSLVDGLKPGQRKVLFTCMKRRLDKKEIKVAQLAGSVAEISAYHHGEASLMGTIINLAQNFVGSNNINVLQPIGQFGTRLSGGKDSASPRYIFTQLSPLARHVFNENDDPLLSFLTDDNQKIEPEWYIPILPMVLVNGADGIGTGWMTKIPNYNPREIVANLKRLLKGQEIKDMVPWYKNFRGTIEPLDRERFVVNGEISSLSDTKLEITELPIKTWTNGYKERLEEMLQGSEKSPASIQDYKDYNTDKTVKFIVQMAANKLQEAEKGGLHTFFKLQTTMSITSMVLFDHLGCLRKYDSVGQILTEFFDLRLIYYDKRKKYLEGLLGAEACKLSNQARFILEKCDGTLKIENKKKKIMIEELKRKGYESDPLKAWRKAATGDEGEEETQEDEENQEEGASQVAKDKGPDYDYLLGMPMWNLTQEKKDEIIRKRDEKNQELKKLQATTKEEMWERDLDEFSAKLDEVEAKEAEEAAGDATTVVEAGGKKKGKAKKGAVKVETLPSAHGIRVEPQIAEELKTKYAKAAAAKERKALKGEKVKKEKNVKEEKDEFDEMAETKTSLSDSGKKLKQSKLGFKPKKEESQPKKPSRNPWSDDEDEISGSENDDDDIAPRQKAGSRAAASKSIKYQMDESSDSDFVNDNRGRNALDTSESDFESAPKSKKQGGKPSKIESDDGSPEVLDIDSDSDKGANDKDEFDVSDSDDGGSLAKKVTSQGKKPPPKKLAKSSDLFSTMMAGGGGASKPKSGPAKKLPVPKKPTEGSKRPKKSESQSENDKPAKKKPKKVIESDSDADLFENDGPPGPPGPRSKAGGGRSKAPVKYSGFDESDSSDC